MYFLDGGEEYREVLKHDTVEEVALCDIDEVCCSIYYILSPLILRRQLYAY